MLTFGDRVSFCLFQRRNETPDPDFFCGYTITTKINDHFTFGVPTLNSPHSSSVTPDPKGPGHDPEWAVGKAVGGRSPFPQRDALLAHPPAQRPCVGSGMSGNPEPQVGIMFCGHVSQQMWRDRN